MEGQRSSTSHILPVSREWDAELSPGTKLFRVPTFEETRRWCPCDLIRLFFAAPMCCAVLCCAVRSSISNSSGHKNVKNVWPRNTYTSSHVKRKHTRPWVLDQTISKASPFLFILMTHFPQLGEKKKTSSSQRSMLKYQGGLPNRKLSTRKHLYLLSKGFTATQ